MLQNRRSTRFALGAFAAACLVLAALLLTTGPAVASHDVTTDRTAGDDRFETAVEIASSAFPDGADVAFLARADNFADGLAAAPLARSVGGPVLLTRPGEVPATTSQALADLSVEEVVLLGGTAAIGEHVADELAEDYDVSRVWGDTRYDTAAAVAGEVAATDAGVGTVDGLRTAFVVTGEDFPDALAAGAPAAAQDDALPILLTLPGQLPDATTEAVGELELEQVVIIGGPVAVSEEVADELEALDVEVARVAGEHRVATAARVADFTVANFDATGERALLARSDDFPDAMAAGPYAGLTDRPILLAGSPGALGTGEEWFDSACLLIRAVEALGGPAAVSDTVLSDAAGTAEGCHGTWGPVPDAPIEPRMNHSATWSGDRMLVWGGEGPVDFMADDGAAWDPAAREWRVLPPAPIEPRWGHDAEWIGDELFVWGGTEGPDHLAACFLDGARYRPIAGEWQEVPPAPGDQRCGATATWTGEEFVVFGGHTSAGPPLPGDLKDDGVAYDPATDEWREIPAAPIPARTGAVSVWTGSEVLVLGGSDEALEPFNDGAAYDPATDEWREIPDSPLEARAAIQGVWIGDELMVFGGSDTDATPPEPATDAAAFDPDTDTWRELSDLPGPQANARVAWTGTVLYLVGGDAIDEEGPSFLAYHPDDDAWEEGPAMPGSPRAQHEIAWTGDELLVWGGIAHGEPAPAVTWRPEE